MKGIAIALAGLMGLAALQPAQAQFSIPHGPFANSQAVAAWWNANNSSSVKTQVFYNGKKIYQRLEGFNPPIIVKYYQCNQTNDVRTLCGHSLDAFTTSDAVVDRIDTINGARPALADSDIYLDNVLVRPLTVPGPVPPDKKYYLMTCKGDASILEPAGNTYYRVRGWTPTFNPAYLGHCYPVM
ncbi:hypothetical protein [Lysobacter sp. CA199]|uniref:hypothetical protein n=1 Tax=Lysobacter sp. CA199 TaxID=3455608 RepID=UPI003F8D3BB0